MKIIALEIERENVDQNDFKKYGREEAEKLWQLYKNGIVREFYFRDDQNTAVLILEASDLDEAQSKLSELPFVKNELITFNLIPLKPYRGFERLFK